MVSRHICLFCLRYKTQQQERTFFTCWQKLPGSHLSWPSLTSCNRRQSPQPLQAINTHTCLLLSDVHRILCNCDDLGGGKGGGVGEGRNLGMGRRLFTVVFEFCCIYVTSKFLFKNISNLHRGVRNKCNSPVPTTKFTYLAFLPLPLPSPSPWTTPTTLSSAPGMKPKN